MSDNRWARVRRAVGRRLGVDPRALAALRIGVGLLAFADLLLRSRNLTAFYTDAGVLPRAVLRERSPALARVSLHALSGAAWFEAALFVLAGAAALALAAGYRTRLATLVSAVLLASLHARNPLVVSAGDSLLRRLLLWGLFLPLGARWSVDAASRRNDDRHATTTDRVASVASAALLLQVLLVYVVNAAFKLRGDRWVGGDGVRYVFSLDQFLVGVGPLLAASPAALVALGYAWLALLVLSPLLVLSTGRTRAALTGLLVAGHLGMAATLLLGLFPWICIVALLPFLPPAVWDAVDAHAPDGVPRRVSRAWTRLGALLPAARPSLPTRASLPGVTVPSSVSAGRGRAASVLASVLLVGMLAWNAAALGLVSTPDGVSDTASPPERTWDMFAPDPMSVDGWYVVPGELESGERVDAFRGGPVEWSKPPDVSATYPGWRWRTYLVDLWRSDSRSLGHAFGSYLCDRWNASHETDLVRVTPHYVTQETRLQGSEPVDRVRLLEHTCGREAPARKRDR